MKRLVQWTPSKLSPQNTLKTKPNTWSLFFFLYIMWIKPLENLKPFILKTQQINGKIFFTSTLKYLRKPNYIFGDHWKLLSDSSKRKQISMTTALVNVSD